MTKYKECDIYRISSCKYIAVYSPPNKWEWTNHNYIQPDEHHKRVKWRMPETSVHTVYIL